MSCSSKSPLRFSYPSSSFPTREPYPRFAARHISDSAAEVFKMNVCKRYARCGTITLPYCRRFLLGTGTFPRPGVANSESWLRAVQQETAGSNDRPFLRGAFIPRPSPASCTEESSGPVSLGVCLACSASTRTRDPLLQERAELACAQLRHARFRMFRFRCASGGGALTEIRGGDPSPSLLSHKSRLQGRSTRLATRKPGRVHS